MVKEICHKITKYQNNRQDVTFHKILKMSHSKFWNTNTNAIIIN